MVGEILGFALMLFKERKLIWKLKNELLNYRLETFEEERLYSSYSRNL